MKVPFEDNQESGCLSGHTEQGARGGFAHFTEYSLPNGGADTTGQSQTFLSFSMNRWINENVGHSLCLNLTIQYSYKFVLVVV